MNLRVILILLISSTLFSQPKIEGIRDIVIEKGMRFFLELKASYISNGKIKISAPNCIHIEKREYNFGDLYSSTEIPFYVYGKADCETGLYTINITTESGIYENTWFIPVFVIKNFRISDYSPKILKRGEINEVNFFLKDYEYCDSICLNVGGSLNCLEKDKNYIIAKIPGGVKRLSVELLCNFYGKELRKHYNISFLTLKEIPEVKIIDGEISDNKIEIEVSKPGIYCFDVYPPLYLKENCLKLSGRTSIEIYITERTNRTRFLIKMIYHGKENEMEYHIPLYLMNLPEIKIYYSGIDFKSKKIILLVSNEGKGPANSIKIKYGKRLYFIKKLEENDLKVIYIPYKERVHLELEYKDINGNRFSRNFTIEPEFVIFKKKESVGRFEVGLGILITISLIILAWRLRR